MYAELGISGGLLFLILSISSLVLRDIEVSEGVTTAVSLLIYLAIAALAINWFLALINSNLWKPTWVIWLENHYDQNQIEQLRQQAQEIGLKQWESQVMTQHDLENWITAVLSPSSLSAPPTS
jgi:predicted PurR-regulated permease PerM